MKMSTVVFWAGMPCSHVHFGGMLVHTHDNTCCHIQETTTDKNKCKMYAKLAFRYIYQKFT